ncbi:serine/threonine dehydratase [Hyunsoonleella aestuarii]|uniref:Serine/threonine dehydratase n=1 Tax=Hyunsoonleella aestuarii TaxID=912802 RepID=A0ABP8E9S3_9FLAO|nr:serine/threonine dehydratase [Hyunsoonleella aestuarii]
MEPHLTLKDIVDAKRRINKFINDTPILSSSLLNNWLGHEIFFKAENLQKIGAFKARGALNTISWLTENNHKPNHIVANSSGNHAQAVAWASKMFDIPATIYMPDYSSKVKIQATKAYGAQVVLCKTRQEADKQVKRDSLKNGVYWVPPFNHNQVISGQGTAAYDAISKIGDVDAVFAPCGGGGLLSGSLIASKGLLPNVQVIGAEPLLGNDAAESLRQKSIQRLDAAPKTLADGAMTLAVGDITFEYLKQLDGFFEITEEAMIYWTQWLTHLLKLRIEPTSALSMESVFQWLKIQPKKKRVLLILSGGNIDQQTTQKIWVKDYLVTEPHLKDSL